MVVDTSALVAILRLEPEAEAFARRIATAGRPCMSAVSLMEVSLVLSGSRGSAGDWTELSALLNRTAMEIVAMDESQALLAREAFLRYGKGRHPATLNMGDCASYALAKSRGLPLLFKGTDFPRTDIGAAA